MRRIALALLLFCLSALPLHAQAPPAGFVTVTGTRILDGGVLLPGGRITAQFLAKGVSFGTSIGGGGQATTSPIVGRIINGAFSFALPDTYLTVPQNACLRVTVTDPAGNILLTKSCVQPSSAPTGPSTTWCSTAGGITTCNFDLYTEALPAVAMSTPGPPGRDGAQGPPGPSATGLNAQSAATTGHNGIANLLTGPCLSGACLIAVPPTYAATEANPFAQLLTPNSVVAAAALPPGTTIADQRGGADWMGFTNPSNGIVLGSPSYQGFYRSRAENRATTDFLGSGGGGLPILGAGQFDVLYTGNGNDDGASNHGKSTFLGLPINVTANSTGQLGGGGYHLNCYGNAGDCNTNEHYIFSAAGSGMGGGEGTHGTWEKIYGVASVPVGPCIAGCTPGSTQVKLSSSLQKQLGQNRYLLDVSKATSTGSLVSGTPSAGSNSPTPFPSATFSGTAFAQSMFLESSAGVSDPPGSTSPGLLTIPIKTVPDFAGFAGATTGLLPSGIACIADSNMGNGGHWETAPYTVVDATHLSIRFYHLHFPNFAIGIGGVCGTGFEQTANTVNNVRQIFPALGSLNGTTVLLASQSNIFGLSGASAFAHIACPAFAVSRTANVVTMYVANGCTGGALSSLHGLHVNVSGMADASFNASNVLATITSSYTQITYPAPGPDAPIAAVSAGAMTYWTPGYVMYPMAESQSVINPATKDVDGTVTLGANNVPFAAGDTLEQPVGSFPLYNGGAQTLNAPVPVLANSHGYIVELMGQEAFNPGTVGYYVVNDQPVTVYQGGGGTNPLPDAAYGSAGQFNYTFNVQAGKLGVVNIRPSDFCNPITTVYCTFPLLNNQTSRLTLQHDPSGQTPDVYLFDNGVPRVRSLQIIDSATSGPNNGVIHTLTISNGSIVITP